VELFSPHVVGSFSPLEFDAPVYDQIHQEQIVAGDMTLNIVENPAVQEQVVVQEIPQDAGSLPPFEEFDVPVHNHIHQRHIVAEETTQNIVENPVVQEQVIVQEILQDSIVERMQAPKVVDSFPFLEDFAATVLPHIILQEIPQVQVVERIQEQSAVTDTVEVVDSLSVSEEVGTLADMTSHNTSSTSTSLCSTLSISDDIAEMLDRLQNIEKATERAATLTKRTMETPLVVC